MAYAAEAAAAKQAFAASHLDKAFGLLERAHVLGQPWAGARNWTHWMMLQIGWRRRDWARGAWAGHPPRCERFAVLAEPPACGKTQVARTHPPPPYALAGRASRPLPLNGV